MSEFRYLISSDTHLLFEWIKERGLIRIPIFLLIGIVGIVLAGISSQNTLLEETGIGIFTATSIFTLHEILHYRIHRFIQSWDIYLTNCVVVLVDIVVAIPMFAYGNLSANYAETIAGFLIISGSIWGIGWMLHNRIGGEILSEDLEKISTNIESDVWDHVWFARTAGTLMLIVGVVFLQLLSPLNVAALSLFFCLFPFLFIDMSHYEFVSIFVFVRNFTRFLVYFARFVQLHSIGAYFLALVFWMLSFEWIYYYPETLLNDTPSDIVLLLILVSWGSITLVIWSPYMIKIYHVTKGVVDRVR